MPKVRLDGYEFYFFSNEGNEPPHVHVMIDGVRLKFWLNNGNLAASKRQQLRIGQHKINRVMQVIHQNSALLWEIWNEHDNRKHDSR